MLGESMATGNCSRRRTGDGARGPQSPGRGRKIVSVAPIHDGASVFHALVEMSLVPMVLVDPHQDDYPIVFANSAFAEMTGYTISEIVGRNCRFLQGPATDPVVVGRIRKAITDRWHFHEELVNYRRDGSAFWNALFINPVFDQAGNLVFFFGMQLDVTCRRNTEEVLKQLQELFSGFDSDTLELLADKR